MDTEKGVQCKTSSLLLPQTHVTGRDLLYIQWSVLTFKTDTWLHSLCKNVELETTAIGPSRPQQLRTTEANKQMQTRRLRQADYSWHRAGYVCKTEPSQVNSRPNIPATAANHPNRPRRVTFVCFGGPTKALLRQFERLHRIDDWKRALRDPVILYELVLEELYAQLDDMVTQYGKVFGNLEHVTLALISRT